MELVEASEVSLSQFGASASLRQATGPEAQLVRVWCGPMYAGKTTAMMEEAQRLQGEGLNVHFIKAKRDYRFSPTHLRNHDGKGIKADQIVGSLEDVSVDGVDALAIDELHFFKSAA